MKSTVGERGQITIPNALRKQLGLRPGMRLEITEEDGAIVLRKPGIEAAIEKWAGSAENPYASTDEFLAELRDSDKEPD